MFLQAAAYMNMFGADARQASQRLKSESMKLQVPCVCASVCNTCVLCMYVCHVTYLCMHVCMHVRVHAKPLTNVCVHTSISIHVGVYLFMYLCIWRDSINGWILMIIVCMQVLKYFVLVRSKGFYKSNIHTCVHICTSETIPAKNHDPRQNTRIRTHYHRKKRTKKKLLAAHVPAR
jgi:hypothetical protein